MNILFKDNNKEFWNEKELKQLKENSKLKAKIRKMINIYMLKIK